MELIIVQQGTGLHYELSHHFLDTILTHADRAAWSSMLPFIGPVGRLKLYLPSEHLSKDDCFLHRRQISGYFCNGEWIDLYKIQNEKYNMLKKQHLDILPFISHFSENQIAEKFKGTYSKNTIHSNKGEIYDLLEIHSKTELSDFMQSLNINPVLNTLNKRNFPPIKTRPPFGG